MRFFTTLTALASLLLWGCIFDKNSSGEGPDYKIEDGLISGTVDEDVTLDADQVYELSDFVFIDSGATLTIPAGTIFKSGGRGALIVKPGAKVMANGTASKPVVFTSKETSPQSGDWAGIVLFGRAPVSSPDGILAFEADEDETFGGDVADDNSGTLQYVRIEYAGFTVAEDAELNGLTLGGVGSGTTLRYIQVHEGLDDGIEWFGGTAHSEYLIVTGASDDGFDIDEGYTGTSQYMLNIQDAESDRGIEAGSKARDLNHITAPTWSNITIIANSAGPAVELKDNVSGKYEKMVIVGENTEAVVSVKGAVTLAKVNDGSTTFPTSFFSGTFTTPFLADGDATAQTAIADQFTETFDALNADLSANAQNVDSAKAGAIVDGNLWYEGWSTGITFNTGSVLTATLSGTISENSRMVAATTYELLDFVYVDAGATLTIEAGTKIRSGGRGALIVKPGAKIVARGTASNPIVFTSKETSPQSGDWAGIVIFGNAPVSSPDGILAFEADANQTFGGTNSADNSGVLEYVRIEYAGFTVALDAELNGLTLGGVGSGTTLRYIQVHEGLDDGIEWFGGTSHSEYLVVTGASDDGFDIDEGYTGTSQYMLNIQDSESDRGIEAGSKARDANHITSPTWSNITIIANESGPAVELKDNVSGSYTKMVIVGDNTAAAVDVKGAVTLAKVNDGSTKFTNSFYSGSFVSPVLSDGDSTAAATIRAQLTSSSSALKDDFTSNDAAITTAGAGAIVGNNLWYQNWTVGVDFTSSAILSKTVQGNITENSTMVSDSTYELVDFVYVDSGVTLMVEAGTQIRSGGRGALIVNPGARLIARGTATNPIVFTSKEATPTSGDWAGVVIFGNAPVSSPDGILAFEADANQTFGGTDSTDNSGVLEYVRIEYAGFTVALDAELNGLTLGGVGSGTTLRYIQVHEGLDDGIEWFGGTSHSEYLVVTGASDDGFDIDEGYTGTSQYMLNVQDSESDRGIEAGSKARDPNHITAPTWSNITIIANNSGPAVELKDNVSGKYEKMVIVGDSSAGVVDVKGAVTVAKVNDGTTLFTNSFYGGTFTTHFLGDGDATAVATITAQFAASTDPLNADYSAKDDSIKVVGAGAIVDSVLWYQDWTVGL